MLSELAHLETQLRTHRFWRDIGNALLLFGVLVEPIIDIFWTESPSLPLSRSRRATTPLKGRFEQLRKPVVLLVGLIVFGGIGLEWWEGTKADDVADQIRAIQQTRIAEAEDRATHAQQSADKSNERATSALKAASAATDRAARTETDLTKANVRAAQLSKDAEQLRKDAEVAKAEQEKLKVDNLELLKMIQPRTVPYDPERIGLLKPFMGTEVLIEAVPDIEANRLAGQIAWVVTQVGWKPQFVGESQTGVSPLAIEDGVTVAVQIILGVEIPNLSPPPSDAPLVKKGFEAGKALERYLEHFDIDPTLAQSITPRPPPLKRALPIGAICVLVGMRPIMKEIWHRQWLERLPEQTRKWMESNERRWKDQ
jgi:hypothetical protein